MSVVAAAKLLAARLYRRLRGDMLWVAVTGSAGKTTTSSLIAAVLARRGPVLDGTVIGRANTTALVRRTLLAARPRHRAAVVELSIGSMAADAALVRPDVAVVTRIAGDHRSAYRTLENTAREKSELVRSLAPTGVAILNIDDPHVWAMRAATRARIVSCGTSPEAMLRATDIHAAWPDRLGLTVRYGDETVRVQTRLVGDYAVFPVLAALAVATVAGIPLVEAAAAIATVEPVEGRLCPVHTADGITFIDNSWKSPAHAVAATLDVLRGARAARKIIVFGTISDYAGANGARYRAVARLALEAADIVVFSGRWARSVAKLGDAVAAGRLMMFDDIAATRAALRALLRPGDLVVIQGSVRSDHLERIVLDRVRRVDCWSTTCRLFQRCTRCPELARPAT